MNLLSSTRLLFASSLLVLSCSATALAAATVTVTPTGDKSFSVLGSGMSGVAGIQLDISYDSASLSNPTVAQGALVSGAMLAANTTLPGSIRIAIISSKPFSANGQIATITFANRQGNGGITYANVSMIDSNRAAFPASASITGGAGGSSQNLTSNLNEPTTKNIDQSTTTTQPSATTTPTYLGTVALPADLQQQAESKQTTASADPAYTAEATAERNALQHSQPKDKSGVEAKTEETPQYIAFKGISERFKQYNGSKKLSDVEALFNKKVAQTVNQKPALLLSNGQNKASLTIDIPSRIKTSPNFAVNGGTLVSFKQEKTIKGRWIVDVLPEVGASKVTITIIAGAEEFEYPLTVAPPVKTALTFDEKGWERFLKEVGTSKTPLHDFNIDGKRDYMDEYIFVANYISKKAAEVKPAAAKAPKKK